MGGRVRGLMAPKRSSESMEELDRTASRTSSVRRQGAREREVRPVMLLRARTMEGMNESICSGGSSRSLMEIPRSLQANEE